jgi:hypothetical protein
MRGLLYNKADYYSGIAHMLFNSGCAGATCITKEAIFV